MDAALYELLDNGTMVLTASRRLAHWLSSSFAEHAQAMGRTVWPTPQVLPWSAFIRNACREQRSSGQHGARLLSDLQALALWDRIVSDSAAGQPLLNPSQAARNAARTWQRLHEYLVPLQSVAAYPTEEAQAFAGWAQTFQQHTQQRGWLDAARFSDSLLRNDYVPSQALALLGFDRLTPEMEQLIDYWREHGAAITLLSTPFNNSNVQVLAARESSDELELAARWARHQAEQGTRHVAVVVPQLAPRAADVERTFARIFNPAALQVGAEPEARAFTIAASALLGTYPLVHHALLCLQLVQGHADTLLIGQLLRSPFLVGYEEEAAVRALADIQARQDRREHWDAGELARFAAANQCASLAAAMQGGHVLIQDHRDAALPSRWTERFTRLLQRMGWAQGRALNSTEQQTRVKFYEVLAELSALDELLGQLSFQQALSALRDACNAERFAPESNDQYVTIIDADTIAGMQFDALWVMGLHAGEWPPSLDPDPLLPLELQRQYRMPNASAAQCLQTAQQTLERLVQSADQVVLSWPQHDEDAELRPSPLLTKWLQIEAHELAIANTVSVARQQFTHRPTLESFIDTSAPPVRAAQVKGGAQVFELQSRCAFRAQAQLRLGAEPVPNVTLAIEPIERGVLVHRVLDTLWRELQGSEGLQRVLREPQERFLEHIKDIAERVALRLIPSTTAHRQHLVALEVELVTRWIYALLQMEAQRPPFTVRRAEQRESFEFANLNINIQLDRVDQLEDGSNLLIDYKTGDANQPRDWLDVSSPGRPRSPQLPLYALANRENLGGIAFAVLAPGAQEFRGLANTGELQTIGIRDYASLKPYTKPAGVESWDDLLVHWQAVLSNLGMQFLSGDATVDPLRGECEYCHLSGLCRIKEVSAVRTEAENGDE